MHIPTYAEAFAEGKRPDILFWVGCMGSFDDRAKKITVAFARILQAAQIDFAILGQEETCHGDPARRLGNEYLYQMLAKGTIETGVRSRDWVEVLRGLDLLIEPGEIALDRFARRANGKAAAIVRSRNEQSTVRRDVV